MKHISKLMLSLLLIINVLSCTKDDGYIEDANEKGLTSCPDNSSCQYLYIEDADVTEGRGISSKGDFRVFFNEVTTNFNTKTVFIKAPMRGNTFFLNDDDIKNGKAMYADNCPVCYSIPVKIIGGSCKGRKINSRTADGTERWLIDATFKLSQTGLDNVNTIHIKQYYYLKSGV